MKLPEGMDTAGASRWIKTHVPEKWQKWKNEQITSFVRDARKLINRYSRERKIQLGVFLVPWKKSENRGALSFLLAQDAGLLAPYIDLFSPMVYHKMVAKPAAWIGEVTDYYADMTGVEIWPIVQAENVDADEFAEVLQTVSDSEAGGMLVYTFTHLEEEHWSLFEQLAFKRNILLNPRLKNDASSGTDIPEQWLRPAVEQVQDSRFWFEGEGEQGNVIGLTAGNDRQAIWSTELPECLPTTSYLFSADFLRQNRRDGLAYPEISLWGQKYLLNTYRMAGKFQRLKTVVTCPENYSEEERIFEFRNNYPRNSFWMRSPELLVREKTSQEISPPPDLNFFPVGTYGANSKNLEVIKDMGLNTAVVRMNMENIQKCLALNMRCTLSVPRSPEKLILALGEFEPLLRQGASAIGYPGIW